MNRRGIPGLMNEVRHPLSICRTTGAVLLALLGFAISSGRAQEPLVLKEVGMLVAPEVAIPNSGQKKQAAMDYLAFSPDGKDANTRGFDRLPGGAPLELPDVVPVHR